MQDDIRSTKRSLTPPRPRPDMAYVRPVPRIARKESTERASLDGFVTPVKIVVEPAVSAKMPEKVVVAQATPKADTKSVVVEKTTIQKIRELENKTVGETDPIVDGVVKKSKSLKNKFSGYKMIYAAAALVFVVGVFALVQGLSVNSQVSEQVKTLSGQAAASGLVQGTQIPSEEKPDPNYLKNYKVAADLPRIIRISSIGVEARVLQVGVDGNNQMGSPSNIYDTAWYTGSSKPGEMGATVIDGHYSGPNTRGVFSKLDRVRAGDVIDIECGDGKIVTYQVVSSETMPVDQVNMAKLLVSSDTARPGLSLITCGGEYEAQNFKFADRTVVYAVQI